MLKRIDGEAEAVETPIGYVPKPEDINIEGLDDVTIDTIKDLLSIDKQAWLEDCEGIKAFYSKFDKDGTLPKELADMEKALEENLKK